MAIRVAILGLDPVQHDWIDALGMLRGEGEIEVVAVADRSLNVAKSIVDALGPPCDEIAAYDDLRTLFKERLPEVVLMDRPAIATVEFLCSCVEQGIGVLSLGPPVESVAEAQALAEALGPRDHRLYVWPRMLDAPAIRHCAQADEFVRPIRFASASWLAVNHAIAKGLPEDAPQKQLVVRSLSALAWDAFATLIEFLGTPSTVYACLRGTPSSAGTFNDLSGAASLTLRFPGPIGGTATDETVVSVTLCDQHPGPAHRDLLLLGKGGSVFLQTNVYAFHNEHGLLIDALPPPPQVPPSSVQAAGTLREFLDHFRQPTSPVRGWDQRLVQIAATMEAMLVSQRTGQAESPERFVHLRR